MKTKELIPVFGIIYKCTNLINGKVYIGQTIKTLKERKLQHEKQKNMFVFQKILHKYGFENFKWETIDSAQNKEELNFKEKVYIKIFNTLVCDGFGYNISKGGHFGDTFSGKSEEEKEKTRKRMSDSATGKKHSKERCEYKKIYQKGNKHKKYSVKGRENCSNAQKKLYEKGYINPNKGRKVSEEERIKNREKNFVRVLQYTKDWDFVKEWSSPCVVYEFLGIQSSNVYACCNNPQKTAGGFKWAYKEKYNLD